jgi:hypothetical protein
MSKTGPRLTPDVDGPRLELLRRADRTMRTARYGASMGTERFAISYDNAWVLTLVGMGPRSSGVEVDPAGIRIRMGSAFTLDITKDFCPFRQPRPVPGRTGRVGCTALGGGGW